MNNPDSDKIVANTYAEITYDTDWQRKKKYAAGIQRASAAQDGGQFVLGITEAAA